MFTVHFIAFNKPISLSFNSFQGAYDLAMLLVACRFDCNITAY